MMPAVFLTVKPGKLSTGEIKRIRNMLRVCTADALTCDHPDGKLTPMDISIRVEGFGELDVPTYDVEIIILANEYADRLANLDDRRHTIVEKVGPLIPFNVNFDVYILLGSGSWEGSRGQKI